MSWTIITQGFKVTAITATTVLDWTQIIGQGHRVKESNLLLHRPCCYLILDTETRQTTNDSADLTPWK